MEIENHVYLETKPLNSLKIIIFFFQSKIVSHNQITMQPHFSLVYRVYGPGQTGQGLGHAAGSVPKQEMGVQLVRVGSRTDHV